MAPNKNSGIKKTLSKTIAEKKTANSYKLSPILFDNSYFHNNGRKIGANTILTYATAQRVLCAPNTEGTSRNCFEKVIRLKSKFKPNIKFQYRFIE